MVQVGQLLGPEESLAAGMVDEVVPISGLQEASMKKMAQLLEASASHLPSRWMASRRLGRLEGVMPCTQVPDESRALSKKMARRDAANKLRELQSDDLDEFMGLVAQPSVQNALKDYLRALKDKSEQ